MTDLISIKNIRIYAYHGCLEDEKRIGQDFYVNATLEISTREAGKADDIDKTIHYGLVTETIHDVMTATSYDLIETCAEKAAEAVLLGYPGVEAITIEIRKPDAPIPREFEDVSVKIRRAWHQAVIAIGANLGDAEAMVEGSFERIGNITDCRLVKKSSILKTAPYGVTDQPEFFNAVCEIRTLLTPHELLDELHKLENESGRVRELRWGPRTLDLDIIMYDDLVLEDDNLCIPHVDMANRDFVLEPLAEILPYKVHPLTGKRVCEMLSSLKSDKREDKEEKIIFV